MPRMKKGIAALLKALSPTDIAKLIAPKVAALQRERRGLAKRLAAIEAQLAGIGVAGPAPAKIRRRRRRGQPGRPPKAVKVMAAKPVVLRAKRGTVAGKIAAILAKAGKPLRVTEICGELVGKGAPRKKGLMSYVSRTLKHNPSFTKVRRGLYRLAAAGPAK